MNGESNANFALSKQTGATAHGRASTQPVQLQGILPHQPLVSCIPSSTRHRYCLGTDHGPVATTRVGRHLIAF